MKIGSLMRRLILLLFPAACLTATPAMTTALAENDAQQAKIAVARPGKKPSSPVVGIHSSQLTGPVSDRHKPHAETFEPVTDSLKRNTSSSSALSSPVLLTVYCLLIVTASVFGGLLPSLFQLTHTRMQIIVSFVGGFMLAIAVLHLIPHAEHQLGNIDTTMLWTMTGILLMFFLIRTFHFHNHGVAEETPEGACDPCEQDHHHSHSHVHSHPDTHQFSWIGILIGLSIHTLLDGIALGSALSLDSVSQDVLPGLGVFLAILLHKPLDAVSITTLMIAGGWKKIHVHVVNTGFAMMCPLGAALVLMGVNQLPGLQQELAGAALAFSAGVFLCIALSDLLPEMEFHSHHRLRLSVALGLGIAAACTIRFLHSHA